VCSATGEPKSVAVARYLLWLAEGEPETERVTHLRLQKLLYYAQAWHLMACGVPLFEDEIQAWQHGPVVAAAYPYFADYGDSPIAHHEAADAAALSDREKQLVDSVWRYYRRFSAAGLRAMTHQERPFREARRGIEEDAPSQRRIELDTLRQFFSEQYERHAHRWEGLALTDFEQAERELDEGKGMFLDDFLKQRRAV